MYPEEKLKKTSGAENSSSGTMSNSVSGGRQIKRSSKHKWSFAGSHSRMRLTGGRKGLSNPNKCNTPGRTVQVLDSDNIDVTPLPLYNALESCSLDEIFSSSGSGHLKSSSSFSMHSSSSFTGSSLSLSKPSLIEGTVDSVPKLDAPMKPPSPCNEMLDEVVELYLSETDTISLLDIPPTFVSEDGNDAEAIDERNLQYAELCKNRVGNEKYVGRSAQTFSEASKDKQVQCDEFVMLDKGTIASNWDIYDSFCDQSAAESEKADCSDITMNTSKCQERSRSNNSGSTFHTGSTISSLFEIEDSLNSEPDPQLIMLSESFQQSLLVMERSIMRDIFQPKLAAYKQLPVLQDPDSTVKSGMEEEGEESSSSPALECLLACSCELTTGWNITCMALNKKNPDILAVGYGDYNASPKTRGLICCWSLKNSKWPEHVLYCHSCVTSLDFSAINPSRLAVGMYDGTVAVYHVHSQNNMECLANSSELLHKHVHPVWQVSWAKQEMTGVDRTNEVFLSVSADGRIMKWSICGDDLLGIDLLKLKNLENLKLEEGKGREKKDNEYVLSALVPGLCVDLHPTESGLYLAGTWKGDIHKCTFSNRQYFLDTYKKHTCPVTHIEWSPFSSDVFLSCSSDWTIRLWKQGRFTPLMSFTSTEKQVLTVRWSPNCSTIFAAINEQQVEIWDLNSTIQNPTIVHQAAPGVKMMSLLFGEGKNCILVGDSDGQVTVYQLKNLSVGEGKQVDSLDDIINSVVSKQLKPKTF